MQLVILAGGLGTRVRSIAGGKPKSLLQIAGRPFIELQLELAVRSGVTDVLLCTGNLGYQIKEHVGNGSRWGLAIQYSNEDPSLLLGTGGALAHAVPHLEHDFLLLYGDSYLPIDYGNVIGALRRRNDSALMCVYRNLGQGDSSNTRVKDDKVVYYSKSAIANEVDYIDYGLTAYRKDVFKEYRNHPIPLELETIVQRLVEQHDLGAYEVEDRFYEIGSPEGMVELDEHLRTKHRCGAQDRRPEPGGEVNDRGQPAVFLDRDGVLIQTLVVDGTPIPAKELSEVKLLPGVPLAVSALRAAGYKLIVVTNQPDVARGTVTMDQVVRVNDQLAARFGFDDIYVCPHDDADRCMCRKPEPGMLINAAKKYCIDLSRSFMVGDRWRDVEAGLRAGCTSVFIDQGYEENHEVRPDATFGSFSEAAAWILMKTPCE